LDFIGNLALSSPPETLRLDPAQARQAGEYSSSAETGDARAGPDNFCPVAHGAVSMVAGQLSLVDTRERDDARRGHDANVSNVSNIVPVSDVHLSSSTAAWNIMVASPHHCQQHLQACERSAPRQLLLSAPKSAQGVNTLALVLVARVGDSASGSSARHEAAGCLDMASRCSFNLPELEKADVSLALMKALSDEVSNPAAPKRLSSLPIPPKTSARAGEGLQTDFSS
jgi:hypothetical protein